LSKELSLLLSQYVRTSRLVRSVATEYIACGRIPPRWCWKYLPEDIERKLLINSLRAELRFFGLDTKDWTDEEIEASVELLGEVLSKVGVSVREAVDGLSKLSEAAGKILTETFKDEGLR
jgi:hypothetical protein